METMQVGDAAFLELPCLPVSNEREAMLEETLTFLTTLPSESVKMALEVYLAKLFCSRGANLLSTSASPF